MALERARRAAYTVRDPFDFAPPPEAPVFEPTADEFRDPLDFIARIRARAEPFGICRIRPPKSWYPPFALDIDRMRFEPRTQRLKELDGVTRLRAHFEDRLCRFWETRGVALHAPTHDGRPVDLFALYHAVRFDGGFERCDAAGKWTKVAAFLGLNHSTPSTLRALYAKVLLPFDEACATPTSPSTSYPSPKKEEPNDDDDGDDAALVIVVDDDDEEEEACGDASKKEESKPEVGKRRRGRPPRSSRTSPVSPTRKRFARRSRELRRLACHGVAGPKMAVCDELDEPKPKRAKDEAVRLRECSVCGRDHRQSELLECDSCALVVHAWCAEPAIERAPIMRWLCSPCLSREMRKPVEAFGFSQSTRSYSLQEFGEMADAFKSNYFGVPGHTVETVVAEREFWRVLSSIDEDVTVEYGADLHSMDHGSGFPTKSSTNLFAGDQEYVDSGWNLTNMPLLDGSVLRFVNDTISGMTVPWMYVGMCFSAFCWHNEDHWSYSINYLHWGEPKTWYGVPGANAVLLENAMKSIAPDLFRSQPDLLHQLVTILNPNVLSEAGVPIYRTDQRAGEFVVTFPRSYHAGFNQGYNFAEAVNFAPSDWLSIGLECVLHYKSLKRFCVFSHEELVCKIALDSDDLDIAIAIPTFKQLYSMIESEKTRRGGLRKVGVARALRYQFECQIDDKRLCKVCNTTCFLSALFCEKCRKMVCLEHTNEICSCPKSEHVLLYRYKLDELHFMFSKLKVRIEKCDRWTTEAKELLTVKSAKLIDRKSRMEKLMEEGKELTMKKTIIFQRVALEYEKIDNSEVIEID